MAGIASRVVCPVTRLAFAVTLVARLIDLDMKAQVIALRTYGGVFYVADLWPGTQWRP